MLLFIILSLSFVTGMGLSAFLNLTSTAFFFLVASVFFVAAALPFVRAHGSKILSLDFAAIADDDEPIPPLTILFLIFFFVAFGIYRYAAIGHTEYRGHVLKIVQQADETTIWHVKGTIVEEPKLKGEYLEVLVKPNTMSIVTKTKQKNEKTGKMETVVATSEPQEVTGGLIMMQVYDNTEAFHQVAFRQNVEIQGQLTEPSSSRNPGALDYRQYLRNRGIYRSIRIIPRHAELKILGEVQGGAIWYRVALYLKNEALQIIKQTMPFPESSFLGGVLLGLRGGLPQEVNDQFRMTGVSHVLAVSGLHVTIIATLLYGIFTVLKIPIKIFAPMIVFSLFTFALIVGWPSSAVRAALMNSLFVISRAYLKDRGFKLSVVFSLCVAVDYILFSAPLQLTEPSFVLSVMAIYALAMFSEPSGELLKKILRGPGLIFAFFATLLYFAVICINRSLVIQPAFFGVTFLYIIAVSLISNWLAGLSSFQSFSFEMLPLWLQSFLASQIAIFIAMMGPLSAFYFGQLSLAAPIANIIAIPLIGVIVQVGLIAAIIGAFVPYIGIYLALLLNAANYLAVKFFLGMAAFFAALIPFPRISQPSFIELMLYYFFLHLFIFRKEILEWGKIIFATSKEVFADDHYKLYGIIIAGTCALAIFIVSLYNFPLLARRPDLRLTMLDVGYGASLLVESKTGYYLIDSALNDTMAEVDRGENVIQPVLTSKKIKYLDGVILTSALPERISGLASVLTAYRVNKIYAPFDIPTDGIKLTLEEYIKKFSLGDRRFESRLNRGEYVSTPPSYYWELAYNSYNKLIENIHKYKVSVQKVKAGDLIAGNLFEVLYPKKETSTFQQYYDGLLLKITSGDQEYLYMSGNSYPLENYAKFKPSFIFAAEIPFPSEEFEKYLDEAKPDGVAISFRFPGAWIMDGFHMSGTIRSRSNTSLSRFKQLNLPVYVTNNSGAVEVESRKGRMFAKSYVND